MGSFVFPQTTKANVRVTNMHIILTKVKITATSLFTALLFTLHVLEIDFNGNYSKKIHLQVSGLLTTQISFPSDTVTLFFWSAPCHTDINRGTWLYVFLHMLQSFVKSIESYTQIFGNPGKCQGYYLQIPIFSWLIISFL